MNVAASSTVNGQSNKMNLIYAYLVQSWHGNANQTSEFTWFILNSDAEIEIPHGDDDALLEMPRENLLSLM